MGDMRFVVSQKRFEARLREYPADAINAVERAMLAGMQIAFRNSQREVPVRTGVLKNSGQLKGPETIGIGVIRMAITYGGAASAYAAYQHDNRTLHHPGGGKAGYVIDPIKAAVPDIKARMERALKRAGHGV